jgi:hypothetical protein
VCGRGVVGDDDCCGVAELLHACSDALDEGALLASVGALDFGDLGHHGVGRECRQGGRYLQELGCERLQVGGLCSRVQQLGLDLRDSGPSGRDAHPGLYAVSGGCGCGCLDPEGVLFLRDQGRRYLGRPAAPVEAEGGCVGDKVPEHMYSVAGQAIEYKA